MGRSPPARVVCATPASNDVNTFATGLQGATFEFDDNAAFSSPSDLCVTPASTDAAGACVSAQVANGNYWVREKAAPAGWNTDSEHRLRRRRVRSESDSSRTTSRSRSTIRTPTTRRFVNRRSNPALTAGCGLNISLVLDRSGSIAPNADGVRGRGEELRRLACVDAVADEDLQLCCDRDRGPEHVRVVEHAGWCELSQRDDRCCVRRTRQGGTNWDAGLQLAINSGSDLVVFITDGNPTARNGDTGSTNLVNLEDVEYGIASANSVKNADQTIWAVGVANTARVGSRRRTSSWCRGRAISSLRISTTSRTTLRALANQLCGSRIHVRKLVGGLPQTGWAFTAAGGGAGVTFGNNPATTLAQVVRTSSASTTSPRTGPRRAVTVTESLAGHPGFSLAAAACQLNSYPAADTGTPTNPQSIAQIQRNQDWYCTFNNEFTKFASSTATVIHNAAHATVTSVPAGTIVHDQATVTGSPGDADGDGDVRRGSPTAPAPGPRRRRRVRFR